MFEPLELMPLPVVPLVVPLLVVDESVALPEFVVPLPMVVEPVALRELVVPVPVVDPMLPDGPERTTPPGVVVVEPVPELLIVPDVELGLVFAAPTPGEPDVPPVALVPEVPEVPDVPVPLRAGSRRAGPGRLREGEAAAASQRHGGRKGENPGSLSHQCLLLRESVHADRQDAEMSTGLFGNRCAAEATADAVLSANPYTRRCASGSRARTAPRSSFPPECRHP